MIRISERATVSVVIPVKNDGDLLRRCLRALALQTRLPDEVVVVDNGSVDASAQVAHDAGARVVRCERPGIAAASATGYDAATSNIVLRLDADCIPAHDWVRTMQQALTRPGVAVCTGGARFLDGPRGARTWAALVYLGAYVAVATPALGHIPLFGSNLGFRRSAWLSVRHRVHRDANIHDDLDLSYHFGDRYRIHYVPGAAMGISMRPLASARGLTRRASWGVRTVVRHWPGDFPPVRWNRFVLRRVLRRLGVLSSRGEP